MSKAVPFRQWTIAPGWQGEDCFIVAGGTSVQPELVASLRGRPNSRVIVINSSYLIAPWADVLFFGDDRWWTNETAVRNEALKYFEGQIVTVGRYVRDARLWHMHKVVPTRRGGNGLTRDPTGLAMEMTSLQGALNIAFHKQAKRVILIGADNRAGDNGRRHYHEEHPWVPTKETWKERAEQLGLAVPFLRDAGIEVINASLISTFTWWPKVDLAQWLGENP